MSERLNLKVHCVLASGANATSKIGSDVTVIAAVGKVARLSKVKVVGVESAPPDDAPLPVPVAFDVTEAELSSASETNLSLSVGALGAGASLLVACLENPPSEARERATGRTGHRECLR